MSNISQLIGRVSQAGFAIVVKDGKPSLKQQRGNKPIPPKLLEELKQNREELLRWFQADVGEPAPEAIQVKEREPGEYQAQDGPNPSEWTTCTVCKSEVNPFQMNMLTMGAWVQCCGMEGNRKTGERPCPYKNGSTRSR